MTTSPDLRRYFDLTVFDRDPAALVDQARLDQAAKFPGLVLATGHPATALIETLALLVAEAGYAVNRLPGAIVAILLRLFGVERSDGVHPTADLTFHLAMPGPTVIAAGTLARLTLATGDVVYFATTADLNIGAGLVDGTVAATATRPTAVANATPAGTFLDPITNVPNLDTVELDTPVTGGAEPEDQWSWLDRGINALARLNDALFLIDHF